MWGRHYHRRGRTQAAGQQPPAPPRG
jgi:hypothetical protein